MHEAESEWITLKVQSVQTSKVIESTGTPRRAQSPEAIERRQQRERRLPPKPAWYGSRESANASALLAKKALTSRGGARAPRG